MPKKLTQKHLRQYFLDGCKKPGDLKIGVEWEKIGVYRNTGRAIPYAGRRGVLAIFRAMIQNYDWQPVYFAKRLIGLKKRGASITLEPGGQIELSGQKADRLAANAAELHSHLSEIHAVSEKMGIVWLGIGAQPISLVREIPWVPKERYRLMRKSLKDKGALTYSMMKETASIQISIDYVSESDAAEKFRLATALSPVLSAMFANSPLTGGKANGFFSRRVYIWRHTAPERTGLVEKAFDPRFSFDDYVDYALGVPMLFIIRNQKMIAVKGVDFRAFLEEGYEGHRARKEDWELHLSTIFTEVRFKRYIEIRCLDCQRTPVALSAPALIKGLFYDKKSRQAAWKLVSGISPVERRRLFMEVPRRGLYVRLGKQDLWPVAFRLLKYAEEGLSRLSPEERGYLTPLKDLILHQHIMPAELLLRCFSAAKTRKQQVKRIIDCASI